MNSHCANLGFVCPVGIESESVTLKAFIKRYDGLDIFLLCRNIIVFLQKDIDMLGKKVIDNKPFSGETAQQIRQESLLVIKSRRQNGGKPQAKQTKNPVILNF